MPRPLFGFLRYKRGHCYGLVSNAGKDATTAFAGVGHSEDAVEMREGNYLIGVLEGYDFEKNPIPVVKKKVEPEPPKPETEPAAEESEPPPAER